MRLPAVSVALALLTAAVGASALTVDFAGLPRGDADEALVNPVGEGARAHKKKLDSLAVQKSVLEAKDDDGVSRCFSDGQRTQRDKWPLSFGSEPKMERIVEKGGNRATLRVDWLSIDGERVYLLDSREMPLELVAKAPTGVKVYAMRDDADTVQFLIASPKRPERLRDGNQIDDTQLVLGDGTQQFGSSSCGHVRVPLRASAKRPAAATVRTTVILSHTERPHGATADVRVRGMYAHLSVSKLGDDDEPVVSVSFGWATPESIAEVVLDDE